MSTKNSNRLFYVVKESYTTYSLYSIQTDHLILAEVAANAISDFLLLNEPHNPAISHLETTSHYLYDSNPNSKGVVNYYTTFYTYESYDRYDSTEVTQWEAFNNLTLDEPDKQLSFNFSSDPEEKREDILANSIDNSYELYTYADKSDDPKTQYDSNLEWKDLNLDDD